MGILSSVIGGVSSILGANSAKDAAKTMAKSNEKMLKAQIAQVAPFREAGVRATGALEPLFGQGSPEQQAAALERFRNSGEYKLNYENMLRDAREDVMAFGAGGTTGLFSGNTLKALQDRAGRISDQLFGNYTSNLFKLSGQGAAAASGNQSVMNAAENRNQDALASAGNASIAGIQGLGTAAQGIASGFKNLVGGGGSSFGPTNILSRNI